MPKVSTRRMRPALSRDVIAEVALRLTLEQPATPLTLARLGAEVCEGLVHTHRDAAER